MFQANNGEKKVHFSENSEESSEYIYERNT